MKLYLLIGEEYSRRGDYSPKQWNIAIFSTREKAQEHFDKIQSEYWQKHKNLPNYTYEIEEYDLDVPPI